MVEMTGIATALQEACRNCGAPILGACCSECGQPRVGRITMRGVLAGIVGGLLDLDSALLRTALDLTRRPGRTVREFVEGARQRYVNPLKYAFIVFTILILVTKFVLPASPAEMGVDWGSGWAVVYSLRAYLTFLILLPVAALQLALFRAESYNFAETYTFAAYSFAQMTLLQMVSGVLIPTGLGWVSLIVIQILSAAYLVWAAAGFYRQHRITTVLKALAIFLAHAAVTTLVYMTTAAIVMRWVQPRS